MLGRFPKITARFVHAQPATFPLRTDLAGGSARRARPSTLGVDQMIVSQERTSGRAPTPAAAADRQSAPILQAALEVAHQDRLWLEQKLLDQKKEQEALREEVDRLREALEARELTAKAAGEQVEAASTEVARLAGRLAKVGQERDTLRLERGALTQERDALAKERDALNLERDALAQERDTLAAQHNTLSRERDGQARLLEQAATEFHEILIRRENLEAEVAFLRSEALPGRGRHDSDMRELGRTLEAMAQSISAVQASTVTAGGGEQRSDNDIIMLEARMRSLLAPLAGLGAMRYDIAKLCDRVEALAENVAAPSAPGPSEIATVDRTALLLVGG